MERIIKKGFNFASLTKGDKISKNGEKYVIKTVGSDSAYIENLKTEKQQEIKSLSGFKPVKVKSLDINESISVRSDFHSDYVENIEVNINGDYKKCQIMYQIKDGIIIWYLNINKSSMSHLLSKQKLVNLAHGEVKYNGPEPLSAEDCYDYCFDQVDDAAMKKYTNKDLDKNISSGSNLSLDNDENNNLYQQHLSENISQTLITNFKLFKSNNDNKIKNI
jgi:hypothetical protein